jgi:hypothetical protein
MKKLIILTILFISTVFAGAENQLDSRRYRAWIVEYQPYRLLIENAVSEYIEVSGENLEVVNPFDTIIIVQTRTGNQSMYQIRYGSNNLGYTIVDKKQTTWILGETLTETILDKDSYYHLDTRIPFAKSKNRPELDYLAENSFWTSTDFQLSPNRFLYRFSNQGGIVYEWGNEYSGRPLSEAGYSRIGISTRVFKLGFQIPGLGIRPGFTIDDDSIDNNLNGGLGAFGSFWYNNVYGEMSFLTNDENTKNYVDFSTLAFFNFGTPVTFIDGALQIKIGAVLERLIRDDIVFAGGPFIRMDFASKLVDNKFSRLVFSLQNVGSTSLLNSIKFNFNESVGISINYLHYYNKEYKLDENGNYKLEDINFYPDNVILFSFDIKFNNPNM